MVFVKLLHNNNIITLDTPGKQIIKSSSGLMFHSSAELLSAALGSCLGKNLVRYCAQNSINVESFEQVAVDFEDNQFHIHINHPKSLTDDNKEEIKNLIRNCSVAQILNTEININLANNNIEPDLTKKPKPCCGG